MEPHSALKESHARNITAAPSPILMRTQKGEPRAGHFLESNTHPFPDGSTYSTKKTIGPQKVPPSPIQHQRQRDLPVRLSNLRRSEIKPPTIMVHNLQHFLTPAMDEALATTLLRHVLSQGQLHSPRVARGALMYQSRHLQRRAIITCHRSLNNGRKKKTAPGKPERKQKGHSCGPDSGSFTRTDAWSDKARQGTLMINYELRTLLKYL